MFYEFIKETKLGKFTALIDLKNLGLGIEFDFNMKPYAIYIHVLCFRAGWESNHLNPLELYFKTLK